MNTFLKLVSRGVFIGIACAVLFVGRQAFALSAPIGVSITNITATGATVSWNAPAGFLDVPNTSSVDRHVIFYKKTGAFGSDSVYALHPLLSKSIVVPSAGTYDVWVVAGSATAPDSPESPQKTFTTTGAPQNTGNSPSTTPDTTAPTAPQNLQIVGIPAVGVLMKWDTSSDPQGPTGEQSTGIKGYNIRYGIGAGATTPVSTSPISRPIAGYRIQLPNLTAGTFYTFAIEAVDNASPQNVSPATFGSFTIPTVNPANDPVCPNGATNYPTCTTGVGAGADGGYKFNVKFINPLCKNDSDCIQDIPTLLNKILDALMLFLVPIVVLFIIYAGFLFVMAQGNETKLTKAKSVLGWTLVGAAILLGAKIITTVLSSTVTNILK